jgi:DNA primase
LVCKLFVCSPYGAINADPKGNNEQRTTNNLITHDTIDRIITAARVEEVVGDFVNLKKRGVNLLGRCPFHNEKTPSFTVSPAKGIYKCFGCGKAGNSINFVMDHEQLSYPEALRYLADKYHIEVEETVQAKEQIEQKTERDSLYILMTAAQKYYTQKLTEDEEGKAVGLSYLKERELKPNIIESFQLGWSGKGRDEFSAWAVQNGYSKEYLVKTGMAFVLGEQKEEVKDSQLMDRFRERIMFPIHNISGKIVGFGGRILRSTGKEAKYINSPETDIYNKSKILYGLYQARKAIRQRDGAIIVEGYMDVLAMHQAGIENVAASSGTSLTEDQLRLVKRFTDNVTFLFDGDAAGQKASLRAIDMALEQELNVKMLLLPAEHDPDSFVKAYDIEYVENYFKEHSQNFIAFRKGLLSEEVLKDPIKKSETAREMLNSVILIKDNIKRTLYIKEIEKALDIEEKVLNDEMRRMAATQFKKENKAQDLNLAEPQLVSQEQAIRTPSNTINQEKQLLKVLLLYGTRLYTDDMTCAHYIYRETTGMEWESLDCQALFEKYKEAAEREDGTGNIDVNFLVQDQTEEMRRFVFDITLERHQLSAGWERFLGRVIVSPDSNYKDEIKSAVGYLKLAKINKIVEDNQKEVANLETDESIDELFTLQKVLLNMRRQLAVDLGIAPANMIGEKG